MEPWNDWRKRAKEWKKDNNLTDSDIAANMPAKEDTGEPPSRAAVQAWLGGRNDPNISDLMALCAAMGADPGLILFGVAVLPNSVRKSSPAHRAMTSSPTASPGHSAFVDKMRKFKSKKSKLRRVLVRG